MANASLILHILEYLCLIFDENNLYEYPSEKCEEKDDLEKIVFKFAKLMLRTTSLSELSLWSQQYQMSVLMK